MAIDAQGGQLPAKQIADVTVSLLSFSSGVKAQVFVSWLHPFKLVSRHTSSVRRQTLDALRRTLDASPHSIGWKNHVSIPKRAQAQPVAFGWEEPLRAECRHSPWRGFPAPSPGAALLRARARFAVLMGASHSQGTMRVTMKPLTPRPGWDMFKSSPR